MATEDDDDLKKSAADRTSPPQRVIAADDVKERLVGRNLGRTILGLVVASVIVGAVLSFVGLNPKEFWSGLFRFFKGLLSALGDSVGEIAMTLATYLVIGAAIVVPIWFVSRLLSGGKK